MKTQNVILTLSVLARADLLAYRFVGFDGTRCPALALALGVAEVDTDSGNMAPVNVQGVMLVESGSTMLSGQVVQADDQGRAVSFQGPGMINGIALDDAAGPGELIRIVRGI